MGGSGCIQVLWLEISEGLGLGLIELGLERTCMMEVRKHIYACICIHTYLHTYNYICGLFVARDLTQEISWLCLGQPDALRAPLKGSRVPREPNTP